MLGVALLIAGAVALGACGSDGSGQTDTTAQLADGPRGGTLVWGKPADVPELDPTTSLNATSWQLLANVYEGLVTIDDQLHPQPVLATSWEQTSATTYVFTIRRGVRFSNGRELTIDDVVGSLQRLTDPKTAANWAAQVGQVKRVSALGDAQVQIELAAPNTAFVASLAGVPAAIMPMKELRAGTFDPRRELIGTGPFKVVSHRKGEAWNLARNPYYWRTGLPKADRLTVRVMPDDAARIAGLQDGSVDVANFDTPDAVELLKGQPNVVTRVIETTDFYRLDVNAKTSLFRDPRLREALMLSLDRSQIADVALAGTSKPSSAVAPAFGTCDPGTLPNATPDAERAAQLVEQAGAKGKTVTLLASTTYKPFGQIAQVLQPALEAAGLKVKIEQPDEGEWLARVFGPKPDFDLSLSFFGSYGDPAMGLTWWGPEQTWHSAWDTTDEQLSTLIARSRTQAAGAARDDTIKAACERIARDTALVPLVTKPMVAAYRADEVNAQLPQLNAYNIPLPNLAEYSVLQR